MCIIPFNYSQYYCWICCIAVWFRCAFSALTLLVGWQECWLRDKKGIRPVKTEWWGAGMVICLEWGADLHMAQLMPLPLTVSCFSKIQIGFTFLVPAHPRSPGQRAVKWGCVCVIQTVGFVWGYVCQQFSQTILILLAGFVLACLVCTVILIMYPFLLVAIVASTLPVLCQ